MARQTVQLPYRIWPVFLPFNPFSTPFFLHASPISPNGVPWPILTFHFGILSGNQQLEAAGVPQGWSASLGNGSSSDQVFVNEAVE
jgi:hypothetical protein